MSEDRLERIKAKLNAETERKRITAANLEQVRREREEREAAVTQLSEEKLELVKSTVDGVNADIKDTGHKLYFQTRPPRNPIASQIADELGTYTIAFRQLGHGATGMDIITVTISKLGRVSMRFGTSSMSPAGSDRLELEDLDEARVRCWIYDFIEKNID